MRRARPTGRSADKCVPIAAIYDIRPWGLRVPSSRVTPVSAVAEILHRIRRFGVPGAPQAAAVPADLVAQAEAELAPVFSLLEPSERQARALVEDAARLADLTRDDAREEVRRLKAETRQRAGAARAEASAARLVEVDREVGQVLADGRREAERITMLMAERLPLLTEQVVQRALSMATRAGEEPGRA